MLAVTATGAINATVITFDGLGLNVEDPVSVDSYLFDYVDYSGWAIDDPANRDLVNEVENGTDFITCLANSVRGCGIIVAAEDGGLFSLHSFDGADGLLNVGGQTIQVTGTYPDASTVVESFLTVANVFTNYQLGIEFTGLSSAEFRGPGSGDYILALDNIEVTRIPEPSSLMIVAIAVAAAMSVCRRRHRPPRKQGG